MKSCQYCGEEIIGKRSNAKYCSDRCKDTSNKRDFRDRRGLSVRTQRGPNTGRSNGRDHVLAVKDVWRASTGRSRHLMDTYGITEDQYEYLLTKQQNRCIICDKHQSELKKRLAVDHNHKTGEIRGLLCDYCNYRVIGRHTDGSLLRRMADYVEQGTGWFVPPKKKRKKRPRRIKNDGE